MRDETDNRCEYLSGTIGAELHCAHWHAADDAEFAGDRASAECCWCGDHEDGSGTCPGPSISRFAWCAVPSHWHDEIIGGTHDLRAWKESAMSVLAEWDRVHDALGRPGPLGRSLALNTLAEVERLVAENARLREALREAAWLAKLARGSSWPGEMAQRVEDAADRVMAAASLSETGGEA